ncbi:MAG: nuclear transport factor 2 family protein [Bacteroidota bacterium]
MQYRVLVYSLLLLAVSCKSTKQFSVDPNAALMVEAQVQRLLQCLNEKNTDCLLDLYADDFKSISPIMEIISKEELIARTVKGFTDNQYVAEMKVEEVQAGAQLAYVVMEYRLFEPGSKDDYQLLIQKKRIDIWRRNASGQWQLQRSAFYDPQVF